MEQIILLVIASLIGYFLKNKEDKTDTPPPINRRVQRSETREIEQTMRRKLTEASKNVIQELEKKVPESGELRKQATKMIQQQEKNVFEHLDKKSYDRSDIIQNVTKRSVQKEINNKSNAPFKFPQTSNELAQAIVMAEILGPPKSKR